MEGTGVAFAPTSLGVALAPTEGGGRAADDPGVGSNVTQLGFAWRAQQISGSKHSQIGT